MAGNIVISQINGGPIGVINAIINGNFQVNQRGVSGTVTLAAGAYGHDRWKAGASGCTYTFATVANVTTLTITAGSLIQVIEGLNLYSGTYALSWTGTAQGKINGSAYSGSGVTGTATGGTNLNIEFGTGTVSLVQFEPGTEVSPFERRDYGRELMMCQRYYHRQGSGLQYLQIGAFLWDGTANCSFNYQLPVTMRAIPTFSRSGGYTSSLGSPNATMYVDSQASTTKAVNLITVGGSGGTSGMSTYIRANNDMAAFFDFSAEL